LQQKKPLFNISRGSKCPLCSCLRARMREAPTGDRSSTTAVECHGNTHGWWSTSSRPLSSEQKTLRLKLTSLSMTRCYRAFCTGTIAGPLKTASRLFALTTFVVIPCCRAPRWRATSADRCMLVEHER